MTQAVRGQCSANSCAVQLQQTAVGQQVHTNLVIAMCGIAKVFVGELVETGACTELQDCLRFSATRLTMEPTRRPNAAH